MEVVVHIESGPAEVVESGQVTTFGGNGLTIVLEMPHDNLVVRFEFVSDESGQPDITTLETEVGWTLTCVNFGDASGRGSSMPVLLGQIGEDLVFLHFRVFRHGTSADRTIHYTFFRADKATVGWRPG